MDNEKTRDLPQPGRELFDPPRPEPFGLERRQMPTPPREAAAVACTILLVAAGIIALLVAAGHFGKGALAGAGVFMLLVATAFFRERS